MDDLRNKPVRPVEHQGHPRLTPIQGDAFARVEWIFQFGFLRQRRCGRDPHLFFRRPGQHDGVVTQDHLASHRVGFKDAELIILDRIGDRIEWREEHHAWRVGIGDIGGNSGTKIDW